MLNALKPHRLTVYTCVILALLSPFLFLLGSFEWLYTPITFADAYIDHTFSFFYDMGYFKTDYYKAARVPWIAPLFYLQQLVGPYLLSPVLTLLSAVTVPALYFFLLKNLFGLRRAFVILPWIIFFPALTGMAAGGILYNNTAAICYILLALVLWSRPEPDSDLNITSKNSNRRSWILLLICGALISNALYTNVIYVHLLILFPVIDVYQQRTWKLQDYFFLFVGAALATFLWGRFNTWHGRPFWFFLSTLKTSEELILNPENQQIWHKPLRKLLFLTRFDAFHLIFYVSAYLTALLVLIKDFFQTRSVPRDCFAWTYLALFSLWIFWHAIGQTALTPPDFSYPLQVAGFLMVTHWLRRAELSVTDVIFFILAAVFLFFCIFYSSELQSSIIAAGRNSTFVLTLLMCVLLGSLFLLPKSGWAHIGYLLVIGFVYSITSYKQLSDESTGARADLKCHYRQESYTGMMNILVNFQNINPQPGGFVVYIGNDEPVPIHQRCFHNRFLAQQEFAKLAGLMAGETLSRYGVLRDPQELTARHFIKFKVHKNPKLVIFTFRNPDISAQILKKAAEFGYQFRFNSEFAEQVAGHQIPYEIYDLTQAPPSPQTQ